MSQLEDLEAIKRLKYKYIRCIDCKLWKELREVFTEDVGAAYNKGQYTANGIDDVMEFLVGALTRTDVATMHTVHCPEIDITSETTAKGTWYLHDYVVNPGEDNGAMPGHSVLQGAGFYGKEPEAGRRVRLQRWRDLQPQQSPDARGRDRGFGGSRAPARDGLRTLFRSRDPRRASILLPGSGFRFTSIRTVG